jgi:hypothetical protein
MHVDFLFHLYCLYSADASVAPQYLPFISRILPAGSLVGCKEEVARFNRRFGQQTPRRWGWGMPAEENVCHPN